jgi:DNA-binding NtrC family response regulator
MKLLYVEDNPFDRDLTRRALLQQVPGLEWDTADSVKAALEKLQARTYEVLLLDMWLPDGCGLDVLLALRRDKQAMAVVAVAGSGDEASVIQYLKSGAQDYIPKRGHYLDTLGARLRQAIACRSETGQLPRVLSVLYVEHSASDVELTQRHFERRAPHLGLTVQTTAEAALAWLRDGGEADVALLDLRLPGMDGLALLAAIRAERPALPCVLITGRGDEAAASQAMQGGAVDYLVKEHGYVTALPWVIEHAHVLSAYTALRRACRRETPAQG